MNIKHDVLEEEKKHDRLSDYKTRSIICDQETRRVHLLNDQKRRKEETYHAFRNISGLLSGSESDLDDETQDVMEWTEVKPKQPRFRDMLMFSEWMVKVPDDFENKWSFVMCPVGKRCIVYTTKGYTSVYSKKGYQLAKFQSALPNGSHRQYPNSEVTILDCIWSSQTKSYYILDLLSWKGQLYMHTEASFRGFWIKSKVEESPEISEKSDKNPHSFIPLTRYPCDLPTISSVMLQYPYFSANEPKVDGILFYHNEGFYTPGYTPLVVWLKPFMVPEVLNIEICEAYLHTQPSSYVGMNHFIEMFEEKQNQKRKRKRRKGKLLEEAEMGEEPQDKMET